MAVLEHLRRWWLDYCDGDWEHGGGIKIRSTDDPPGWELRVDLDGTDEDELEIPANVREAAQAKGIDARVEKMTFRGACGLGQFLELAGLFLTSVGDPFFEGMAVPETGFDALFLGLDRWLSQHLSGQKTKAERIRIETMDNPGWMLVVDYRSTELVGKPLTLDLTMPAFWSQSDIKWEPCQVVWTEEQVPWSQFDRFFLEAKAREFVFTSMGDHSQLGNLMKIFLNHAARYQAPPLSQIL